MAELEGGKPPAQIAREHGIHPSLPSRLRDELADNPEKAFSGNGNKYKEQEKIAELERMIGQLHAENEENSYTGILFQVASSGVLRHKTTPLCLRCS